MEHFVLLLEFLKPKFSTIKTVRKVQTPVFTQQTLTFFSSGKAANIEL